MTDEERSERLQLSVEIISRFLGPAFTELPISHFERVLHAPDQDTFKTEAR